MAKYSRLMIHRQNKFSVLKTVFKRNVIDFSFLTEFYVEGRIRVLKCLYYV